MRDFALRAALWAYCDEAATLLRRERESGAELPFDVVESSAARMGRTPLYCYRPMTTEFIRDRRSWLALLPARPAAVAALAEMDGLDRYLHARGAPSTPRGSSGRAQAVLDRLVGDLFAEATHFELDSDHFERVYDALESALLAGESHVEVVAVVRGIELESAEIALSDGISLVSLAALNDPPEELIARERGAGSVLARWIEQRRDGDDRPTWRARAWATRLLTPLRLYGDAHVEIDPVGWLRQDGGPWRPLDLGDARRPPDSTITIATLAEDELRGFCNLISRRLPRGGEIAWALARFEMASERRSPAEALTDHLLALRALLEPEGPASGRLPGRVAALCAVPTRRRELAGRLSQAVSLERAVIAGLMPPESGLEAIVDELTGHLRALLRDVLCGHLDSDLRTVADELIAREADTRLDQESEPEDVGWSTDPEPELELAEDQPVPAEDQPVPAGH